MTTKRAFEERDRMLLSGDSHLFCTCESKLEKVIDAANCVVDTAFGDTNGLNETEQLIALRMAAEYLKTELEKLQW